VAGSGKERREEKNINNIYVLPVHKIRTTLHGMVGSGKDEYREVLVWGKGCAELPSCGL
jgi:hypothetical protein